MSKKGLTPKQDAFVREYLVDLNATQAAIRAGYSKRTARRIGSENVAKPDIAAALQKALRARAERTEVTADRVLQELARIGFADVRDLFEWSEESACFVPSRDLSEDQAAAVSTVKAETTHITDSDGNRETKIKLELKTYDKVAALREIGKHLGIAERHELTGEGGGPVQVTVTRQVIPAVKNKNRIAAALTSDNGKNGHGRP